MFSVCSHGSPTVHQWGGMPGHFVSLHPGPVAASPHHHVRTQAPRGRRNDTPSFRPPQSSFSTDDSRVWRLWSRSHCTVRRPRPWSFKISYVQITFMMDRMGELQGHDSATDPGWTVRVLVQSRERNAGCIFVLALLSYSKNDFLVTETALHKICIADNVNVNVTGYGENHFSSKSPIWQ